MTENEIAKVVVDVAFGIHTGLGPGLLESVYRTVMADRLARRGLQVETQAPVPLIFDGFCFEKGFFADLIVNDKVIVEVKSVDKLHAVQSKQLLTNLRLTDKRLGLVINFSGARLKDSISRVVNRLPE